MALVTGVLARSLASNENLEVLEHSMKGIVGALVYGEPDPKKASVTAAIQPGSPAQEMLLELGILIDGTDVPGNVPGAYWYRNPKNGILQPIDAVPEDADPELLIPNVAIGHDRLEDYKMQVGGVVIGALVAATYVADRANPIFNIFNQRLELNQVGALITLSPNSRWVDLSNSSAN